VKTEKSRGVMLALSGLWRKREAMLEVRDSWEGKSEGFGYEGGVVC